VVQSDYVTFVSVKPLISFIAITSLFSSFGKLKRLAEKNVAEMTYTVSSRTFNSTSLEKFCYEYFIELHLYPWPHQNGMKMSEKGWNNKSVDYDLQTFEVHALIFSLQFSPLTSTVAILVQL